MARKREGQSVTPEDLVAQAGEPQTFTCKYNVHPNSSKITVHWRKQLTSMQSVLVWMTETDIGGLSISAPGPGYDEERLRGEPAALPDILTHHALTFRRLLPRDDGCYECYLTCYLPQEERHYIIIIPFKITVRGNHLPLDNSLINHLVFRQIRLIYTSPKQSHGVPALFLR